MKRVGIPIRNKEELEWVRKQFKAQMGVPLLTPEQFQKIQAHYERQAQIKRLEQKAKYESNAQVQRWRTLTKEEQARNAIDRSTESIKTYNDFKAGHDTTESEARAKATELAYKSDKG